MKKIVATFLFAVSSIILTAQINGNFREVRHYGIDSANVSTRDGNVFYNSATNFLMVRMNGSWKRILANANGVVPSIAYSTSTYVPTMNSSNNGFAYSGNFYYDITNNNFRAARSVTYTNSGTKDNNVIIGESSQLTGVGNIRWATLITEQGILAATTQGMHNPLIIGGFNNTINNTNATALGSFSCSIVGSNNSVINATTATTVSSGVLYGRNCTITDCSVATASGYHGKVTGTAGYAHGYFTTMTAAGTSHTGTVQDVLSSGKHAFNHSGNSTASVAGEGARGDQCAILGGYDHDNTGTNSVILGGSGIKLSVNNMVAIPSGMIVTTPTNTNTNTQVLNRNATTGIIEYRSVLQGSAALNFGSIAAGATETLTVTITGAVDGDIVTYSIPNGSKTAGLIFGTAWVSAADTISIECYNSTGSSIDPASGTFKVNVFK